MNILDTLLGITLDEDSNDTAWWEEAVFRGLARKGLNDPAEEREVGESGLSQDSELI